MIPVLTHERSYIRRFSFMIVYKDLPWADVPKLKAEGADPSKISIRARHEPSHPSGFASHGESTVRVQIAMWSFWKAEVICTLFIDLSADFPWWNWQPLVYFSAEESTIAFVEERLNTVGDERQCHKRVTDLFMLPSLRVILTNVLFYGWPSRFQSQLYRSIEGRNHTNEQLPNSMIHSYWPLVGLLESGSLM